MMKNPAFTPPPPPPTQISSESGAYAFLSLWKRWISLAKHRLSLGNPVRARAGATAPTPYYSPTLLLSRKRERKYRHKRGFTLIELSMVLVIIGLLVGGVLTAQELISKAAVRAEISQVEKFNAAAATFQGKYGGLPGDLKDPDASNFGFQARGQYAGQGDGNGVLEGFEWNSSNQDFGYEETSGEVVVFWVDLSQAHLIDGGFSSASETVASSGVTATTSPNIAAYLPAAKIGQGNYVYVWSGGVSSNGNGTGNGSNYFGVSVPSSLAYFGGMFSSPGMTVAQAYAIDSKADDGSPQTGRITASYLNAGTVSGNTRIWASGGGVAGASPGTAASPSSTTCYDNGGNSSNPMAYSVTQNNGSGVNCALSFRMQAGD